MRTGGKHLMIIHPRNHHTPNDEHTKKTTEFSCFFCVIFDSVFTHIIVAWRHVLFAAVTEYPTYALHNTAQTEAITSNNRQVEIVNEHRYSKTASMGWKNHSTVISNKKGNTFCGLHTHTQTYPPCESNQISSNRKIGMR